MNPHNLKVEYRRFGPSDPRIAQLPSLHRVLQISEFDDDAASIWWLIEPALIGDAKARTGGGSADWLGVNYAEWSPTLSNRGSFR